MAEIKELLFVQNRSAERVQKGGWDTVEVFVPGENEKPLKIKGFRGGRNRTRTCDPIDVNDVLSLSGQNIKPLSKPPDPLISKGWRLLGVRRFSSKGYAIRLNVQCAQLIG